MKDDITLRKILQQKIIKIKQMPKSVQKEVEKVMAIKYNVKYGDTVDIFNEITPFLIEDLSYDMLFKLVNSILEVAVNKHLDLDLSNFDVHIYFTNNEIIEFEKPYPILNRDIDIVIRNWKQVNPYKFTIFTDISEVIRWRNYNKLRFNPETQRDLITIISKGIPIKKLDINRSSINSMKNLMVKGLYFPVRGIININPDYFEPPIIDKNNLIIPMESHMDLIEGFHNYIAMCEVKDENPDWEYQCEFDIMLLSTEDANRFILQMDKKNHFKEAQVIRIDKLNQVNYVIDQLNKTSDFHLYGSIDNEMKVYLNKIISVLFNLSNNREKALELLTILVNDLNFIIEKYMHFNSAFSKEEWFIFLNIIKYSRDKKINIINILDKYDTSNLLNELHIKKEPQKRHYDIINKHLSEVNENYI